MNEIVTKIVEQEFGIAPSSIEEIRDKGKNNLVFKVVANNQPVILRMSNREGTLELYQKEKWCAEVSKNAPTLCHGNLHPSNVIVDPTGIIHLIDWETATGNKTPQSELAEIYTWNTGKENIAHFMQGYGMKESEVNGMMRDIQTLVLLRLVHVIVRKMSKNDDWSQDAYIKETAIRLAEINDYVQDILFTKNL